MSASPPSPDPPDEPMQSTGDIESFEAFVKRAEPLESEVYQEVIDLTIDSDEENQFVRSVVPFPSVSPKKESREPSQGLADLPATSTCAESLGHDIIMGDSGNVDDAMEIDSTVGHLQSTMGADYQLPELHESVEIPGAFQPGVENISDEALNAMLERGQLDFPDILAPESAPNVDKQHMVEETAASEEAENAADAAQFQKLKRKYNSKKAKGLTDLEEDIEFLRARAAEAERVRFFKKKQQAREHEDAQAHQQESEGLFCSDNESPPPPTGRDPSFGVGPEASLVDEGQHQKKPRKNGNKSRIPASAYERSYQMGLEDVMAKSRKRNSKNEKKSKEPGAKRGRPAGVTKPKDKKAKNSEKGKGKRSGPRSGPEMSGIASLLNNDIIGSAAANAGKPAPPTFTSGVKSTALAELLSSIPAEHRKPYAADSRELDKNAKKFAYRGQGSMKADGAGGWRLKGMKTSLYHYQLLGVGWMRDRENSSTRPFGGLICDSMGFGKTLMLLTNMLEGSAEPTSRNKTTLIVCTSSLTSQWLMEIKKHVEPGALGQVMVYRSGSRFMSDDDVSLLSSCGVVITTYSEVMKQFPTSDPPKHLVRPESIQQWWEEYYPKKCGPLFKIQFRRLILDEAQQIKNPAGKQSRAARALHGKYRFCLSGTPIQNRIEEFYSFFDFLRVDNVGKFETFKLNFCTRSQKASMARLHAILRKCMLRRTAVDSMFGRPILKLPELAHQTVTIDFNKTERAIYMVVKSRFIHRINEWSLGGQIEQKYRNIFVLLLRLRQIAVHPLLVQSTIESLLEAEDIEKLWKITEKETRPAEDRDAPSTLSVLRKMLQKHKSKSPQAIDETAEQMPEESTMGDTGGTFGNSYKFRKYLRRLHENGSWEEAFQRSTCHKCRQIPDDPQLTIPCEHMYCKECLIVMLHDAALEGETRATCLECGNIFQGSEPCVGFNEAALDLEDAATGTRRRKSSTDSEGKDLGWLSMSGPPLPSAKTLAVKSQLLNWFAEDSSTKVIIFTQFLGIIKILSRICTCEGWGFCSFTGAMNVEARDRSLEEFRSNPEKRILLSSLKAGGLGLNLTCASKVCLLDPWWNQSVEDQAYSRIYRIGQEKPVEVKRFVIRDTVDTQLLLAMQERKNAEIDRAVGPNAQPASLSVKELMKLFGPIAIDPVTGSPVVEEEDELEEEFIFVEDQNVEDESDADVATTVPPHPF